MSMVARMQQVQTPGEKNSTSQASKRIHFYQSKRKGPTHVTKPKKFHRNTIHLGNQKTEVT